MNRLNLGDLCLPLRPVLGDVTVSGPDVLITGLVGDSRRVQPGDLFVAAPGSRSDGLAHVPEALARGAAAVLAERRPELPEEVGFVGVPDVAAAKPWVADRYFGHPSGRLDVVGITGTNGKTTSAAMLSSMLSMDGRDHGVVGTLGARLGSTEEPLTNTTPDAIELQRLLARMVDANLSAAVMEVSSHGLALGRVDAIDFDVGVFTNLSQDHLDFHQDMESYGRAKGLLFERLGVDGCAVLNADDPWSARYAERSVARVLRYGLGAADADLRARVQRLDIDGSAFAVETDTGRPAFGVAMRLVGRHNIANAMAALGAARALGLSVTAMTTGLAALSAVPGRLEPVDCGQDFRLLVDYAHTPDALSQVLQLLRPLTTGKLHVVFGCGGDRDKGKRPLMGRAAADWADVLWVTSDNPRSEDPAAILDDVLAGLPAGTEHTARVDRREAIEAACRAASGGDIVLVAGKGHETTQTIGDQVSPFDDREVSREVLWTL